MKFDKFISYYKRKKNYHEKTSSMSFCVCEELSVNSIGKLNF